MLTSTSTTKSSTSTTRTRTTTSRTTTSSELVAFGLGSSRGEREGHLLAAVAALRTHLGRLDTASLYESEALLAPGTGSAAPSPPFLNTVVVLRCVARHDPEILLAVAKAIELAAGRRRGPRWAPRRLDIDLLVVGGRQIVSPALTLPHAELVHRRFALRPLAEIAPTLSIPGTGATAMELDRALQRQGVPAPSRRSWSRPP